ncbi:MAG: amidohydrolase family protein [Desulfocapsaceae bacterium]|jgi:predicted TIM-barrel fold metal-dependent hydrolase|nr:amidohydrolase family protein [Desulfocapsaceae bacterium]
MDDLKIVDAHHHFWDPTKNYHPWLCDEPMIPFRYGDYSSIRKPFMPKDYFHVARGHQIVKTVTMEGEWNPEDPVGESLWMQAVADEFGFPHAHVAQAWLDADDVEEVLRAHSEIPLVRSVRHKPRAAESPDKVVSGLPGSMSDPKWRSGYAMLKAYGLHFDLQTPWWHLEEAAALADDFPDTLIILNHTGLPADRSANGLAGWREAMRNLARRDNVVVKISGLGLPGKPWRIEDNEVIIKDALKIFGIDRCMYGSNFPVDGVVADYNTIISGYKKVVEKLPLKEQEKFFHDNAVRIYGL